MRTVVHLSDLHFGREDPAVIAPLADAVLALRPDVIAVSGDLTQRARASQFRSAKRFLERIGCAQVVVPGNHDVPLFNLLARFTRPLGGYLRHITTNLTPSYVDDEIFVIGANTTRSFTIKGGAIRRTHVEQIAHRLSESGDRLVKIVVAHHPFDISYGVSSRRTRPIVVDRLVDAGADVLLTGHLHVTYAGHTAERYSLRGRSAIVVEAGTALSTRVRDERNAFNVLLIEPSLIRVQHLEYMTATGAFAVVTSSGFEKTPDGWSDRSAEHAARGRS